MCASLLLVAHASTIMKILFDHSSPFILAHGGFQIQIEQTKKALESLGAEVENLRWWDAEQKGDLIHHFSPARNMYLKLAQAQQLPVVMTTLLSETCNRSDSQLKRQGRLTRLLLAFPGGEGVKDQLVWRSFHLCSHNIVGIQAERRVLEKVYRVPSEKISVIPLGLSEAYLDLPLSRRSETHLICLGTITPQKNCMQLAAMAIRTQTPILFLGKPYHPADPYWLRFQSLIDGRLISYRPHVEDQRELIDLLQGARGYVLMSDYENWSLSAHEAAACGLPLLLPDQPWSRECFGNQAHYFTGKGAAQDEEILRSFYRDAERLPSPQIKLYSWCDTAKQLMQIYSRLCGT